MNKNIDIVVGMCQLTFFRFYLLTNSNRQTGDRGHIIVLLCRRVADRQTDGRNNKNKKKTPNKHKQQCSDKGGDVSAAM